MKYSLVAPTTEPPYLRNLMMCAAILPCMFQVEIEELHDDSTAQRAHAIGEPPQNSRGSSELSGFLWLVVLISIRLIPRPLIASPTQTRPQVYFSNRSAAYLKLGDAKSKALKDAQRCMELAPEWPKSFSRLGAAQHALGRFDGAVQTLKVR